MSSAEVGTLQPRPTDDTTQTVIVVLQPDGKLAIGASRQTFWKFTHSASLIDRGSAVFLERFVGPPSPTRSTDDLQAAAAASKLYTLQHMIFYLIWALDAIYLLAMVVLYARVKGTGHLQGTGAFFLGEAPKAATLVFLLAAMCTEAIGCVAAFLRVVNVLTCSLAANFVVMALATPTMPVFFVGMRGMLLLTGLELRCSYVEMLQQRPPATLIGRPFKAAAAGFRRRFSRNQHYIAGTMSPRHSAYAADYPNV